MGFPSEGLVRLAQICGRGSAADRSQHMVARCYGRTISKPIKLGPRITCWRARDIIALIEKPNLDGEHS